MESNRLVGPGVCHHYVVSSSGAVQPNPDTGKFLSGFYRTEKKAKRSAGLIEKATKVYELKQNEKFWYEGADNAPFYHGYNDGTKHK